MLFQALLSNGQIEFFCLINIQNTETTLQVHGLNTDYSKAFKQKCSTDIQLSEEKVRMRKKVRAAGWF